MKTLLMIADQMVSVIYISPAITYKVEQSSRTELHSQRLKTRELRYRSW